MLALQTQSGKILNSTRIGCDLGGSKCESPPPICLVPCHPVHIGNIPNLVYQTLIKKHVGTPIWEDSITVSCDSGGSKCESPHLSALFPAIPCTQATYLIWSIFLTKKHVGAPIWEDLNSTRVGCDFGGSKCESPHLSAWFCMVLHGSLSSRAHRQHLIWSTKPLSRCRLWFKSFLSAKVPTYLHGSAWLCMVLHGSLPSRAHRQHLIWSIKTLSRNMLAHQPDFDSSAGCDLGGSKCESPHLSALFPAIPCT